MSNKPKNSMRGLLVAALLALASVVFVSNSATAGVGLRLGAALPQSDFKDFARTGWLAEINADLDLLHTPFLSIVVAAGQTDFAKKKHEYAGEGTNPLTQESKMAMTGGGAGLRATPNAVVIKPFFEAMLRIASIEQDYESGLGGSEVESRTRVGYQAAGGISFAAMPTLDIELGISYLTFPGVKVTHEQTEIKTDLKAITIFGGAKVNVGL